jgi:hypothetical protein
MSCLAAPAPDAACLIQQDSVGAVRIGMTVAQVRQALRGVTLRASQDGDGAALLELIRDGVNTSLRPPEMDLYTDAETDINESSKIVLIRIFDTRCSTREGVHPGMRVGEAAKRFGRLKRILLTEIESREYAEFERMPDWLEIQVGDEQVGIYAPGKRCTTNFSPSARINSLWVQHAVIRLPNDDSFCNVTGQR